VQKLLYLQCGEECRATANFFTLKRLKGETVSFLECGMKLYATATVFFVKCEMDCNIRFI